MLPPIFAWPSDPASLPARNRRTALLLVGIFLLLMVLSVIVIWVRN